MFCGTSAGLVSLVNAREQIHDLLRLVHDIIDLVRRAPGQVL